VTVYVRIWASAGVRIAGVCLGGCGESTRITSITLSPPFLGKDAAVGIGSTRAEFEADVDNVQNGGAADSNGVVVYGGSSPALGVFYAQDGSCTERVAGLVFGYVNPN
jgi:hypothetical protein